MARAYMRLTWRSEETSKLKSIFITHSYIIQKKAAKSKYEKVELETSLSLIFISLLMLASRLGLREELIQFMTVAFSSLLFSMEEHP